MFEYIRYKSHNPTESSLVRKLVVEVFDLTPEVLVSWGEMNKNASTIWSMKNAGIEELFYEQGDTIYRAWPDARELTKSESTLLKLSAISTDTSI